MLNSSTLNGEHFLRVPAAKWQIGKELRLAHRSLITQGSLIFIHAFVH
jgi:hypothetical protein